MSDLSEDDSSDDSSKEFLVNPEKINFNSSFFQTSGSKTEPAKSDRDEESSEDDEFHDVTQESNVELFSQVLQNLESTKSSVADESIDKDSGVSGLQNTSQSVTSSNEINELLLLGESGTGSFRKDTEDDGSDEANQETAPAEYSVPKEGVKITLPGTSFLLAKKKKGAPDPLAALRKHFREVQLLVVKVSLLCWLAHGFALNKLVNEPEIMSASLALMSSSNYPKDKINLKYLEKFTKWFRDLFTMETVENFGSTNKEMLLKAIKEKKIMDYSELVLLYIAILRAIGLKCRLVVSLYPPIRKLPQNLQPKTESKSNKAQKSTSVKKSQSKASKSKNTSDKDLAKDSSQKIPVPMNSPEAKRNANLEAKKRAAAILKEKSKSKDKVGSSKTSKTKDSEAKESSSKTSDKSIIKQESTDADDEKNVSGLRRLRSYKTGTATTENVKGKKNLDTASKAANAKIKKEDTDSEMEPVKQTRKRGIKGDSKAISAPKDDGTTSKYYKKEDSDSEKEFMPKKQKPTTRSKAKNTAAAKKDNTSQSYKEEHTDSENEFSPEKRKRTNRGIAKATSLKNENAKSKHNKTEDTDSEEEYKPEPKKRPAKRKLKDGSEQKSDSKSKSSNRKLLSSESDDSDEESPKKGENIWTEVYLESEESWICASVTESKVNCITEVYKKAKKPVLYVIAYNSDGLIKDVTRRYCPKWLTVTRKKRIDEKWWNATVSCWKEKDTAISRAEDEMLLQKELALPLPQTVGECKGHPLYVLARHLLKYEALYPPDCVPLGRTRTGEAIYSRHCVHTLRSRETWIKNARVVKPNQEPYKIVKSLPKYDKLSGMKIKDAALELFGEWQTTEYVPPEAKDGIVPRNEYGNVDLFKQSMLPKGTVHINLPGLNRIARKLNIDCAPAVVGFNFGGMGAVPAFEGFIVCEEYEDTLREAWEAEQVEAIKRAKEKREKRVYGNWKRLIQGLFIRERLAAKYEFAEQQKTTNKRAKQKAGDMRKYKIS